MDENLFSSIVFPIKVYWNKSRDGMINSPQELHTQVDEFPKRQVGFEPERRLNTGKTHHSISFTVNTEFYGGTRQDFLPRELVSLDFSIIS